MRKMSRGVLACSGVVLLGVLAGCSSGSTQQPAPDEQSADKATTSQAAGPEIADPRDVASVQPCELMPPQVAQRAGFQPQGENSEKSADDSLGACSWTLQEDSGTDVTLEGLSRSITDYYKNSGSYRDFVKMKISGHPAVRANNGGTEGFCSMYVATKNGQVLSVLSAMGAEARKNISSCKLAKDTLSAVVPSLPKAQ